MFDRRVSRIVTPGTLIDERFLDPNEHNFLLAVFIEAQSVDNEHSGSVSVEDTPSKEARNVPSVGLAWLDLSTGDFFTQSTSSSSLMSSIAKIGPREIIIQKDPQGEFEKTLVSDLRNYHHLINYFTPTQEDRPQAGWSEMLENTVSEVDRTEFTPEEVSAGNMLLQYARLQLQGMQLRLQSPVRRQVLDNMSIDKNSMRALEIKTTWRDGHFKGSLLHAVRRTSTNSGARLLADRLSMLFPMRRYIASCSSENPSIMSNSQIDFQTNSVQLLLPRLFQKLRIVWTLYSICYKINHYERT